MTGWQPISTAPSKGWFLIYAKDESGWDCIIPARRVRGEAMMLELRNGFPLEYDRFTHWMPYPERPAPAPAPEHWLTRIGRTPTAMTDVWAVR